MNVTGKARMTSIALAMTALIGGGGFVAGAATAGSSRPVSLAGTTSTQSKNTAPASYADVVHQVLPSVVLIRTTEGLGSGVVLDDAGNIVTNAHVAGNATSFQVQLSGDPQPRQARLVGSYPAGDLAVIRVDDKPALKPALKPASFGNSEASRAGDVVLAVGNPLGLSGSVTEGIISATGRAVTEPASGGSPGTTLPDAIQTSAAINPGNSGGALVNTSGQVIGIPTLAAASPGNGAPGSGGQAPGIGFAISANLARDIAGQLIKSGHVTSTHRATIGAHVVPATSPDGAPVGAAIVSVTSGGPADRAGLRIGDVITSVGGAKTPDTSALAEALAIRKPGQSVAATVDRGAQATTVQVTLGELSDG